MDPGYFGELRAAVTGTSPVESGLAALAGLDLRGREAAHVQADLSDQRGGGLPARAGDLI